MAPDAVRTLVAVADALQEARDDWWLIGGSAVALHGLAIDIADVDVLMSARDMHRLIARFHLAPQQGVPVKKVRSDIWVRWTGLPLSVDLMTGLHVRTGETGRGSRPRRGRPSWSRAMRFMSRRASR